MKSCFYILKCILSISYMVTFLLQTLNIIFNFRNKTFKLNSWNAITIYVDTKLIYG